MDQPFDYQNNTPNFEESHSNETSFILDKEVYKAHQEKKNIKKLANIIGLASLVMLALPRIMHLVLQLVIIILSWAGVGTSFVQNAAFLQVYQIIYSITVFLLPFVFIFKRAKFHISDLMSFELSKNKNSFAYFLIGISFCAFSNVIVSSIGAFFSNFGVEYNVPEAKQPEGIYGFMLTFISTAIVPALVEEFACRGLILGALKKYGNGFAVVVSAIVFGVLHGNWGQIPFAFLVGLVLGFVTLKTGSIWTAIFIHAFNNGFSVIFDYSLPLIPDVFQKVAYPIFLMVVMLLGLVAVCLLSRRANAYKLEKDDLESKVSKRYLWFFTAPLAVVFIVLELVKSFSYFKF